MNRSTYIQRTGLICAIIRIYRFRFYLKGIYLPGRLQDGIQHPADDLGLGGIVSATFVLGSVRAGSLLVPGSKNILMKIVVYKVVPA